MNLKAARFTLVLILFLFFSGPLFSQSPIASFTAVDPIVCAGENVQFTNTSTFVPGATFQWTFEDTIANGTSGIQDPSRVYGYAGQYDVKLVVTNPNGSQDSITMANFITVLHPPTADFSFGGRDTVCSGVPVNFTDATQLGDAPLQQWQWSFNDGAPTDSTTGSSITHVYTNVTTQVTTFYPTQTVRDNNQCKSIHSDTLFVLPQPVSAIHIVSNSCTFPATVFFSNTGPQPHIHHWNFGDPTSGANDTSSADSLSHTFNAAGTYTVTLTNGVNGCSVSSTVSVALAAPAAAFTAPTLACLGTPVTFTNTATPVGTTSTWNFGDASPLNFQMSPTHTFNTPGTYTVTLTSKLGNCTNSTTHTITIPPLPLVQVSSPDQQACNVPFTVTYNNSTPGIVGWHWDFDDPAAGGADTSNLQNPQYTFNNFGSYDVTLTVTDNNGCTNSDTYPNYVLIQAPQVSFSIEDSGCVGDIFNYNAVVNSPADNIITDYIWNFGDGTPNDTVHTPNTSHQFNVVGIFDVSLTIITSTGCTATATYQDYARVGTKPIADFYDIDTTICFKGTIAFQDSSYPQPITGWQWTFGDGGGSREQNPSHQYNLDTSGTTPFDVTLIVYYNGCESDPATLTDIITVNSPIPNFGISYNCINPDSVAFTNLTGGGDTYSWDFGDPAVTTDTSTLKDPFYIYTNAGQYNVILSATNILHGCTVDTTLQVTVTHIGAQIILPTTVCYPNTVTFSGSGSPDAIQYNWNFGDPASGVNNTGTGLTPSHLYNLPGDYNVTLTTTDIHNCTASITQVYHMGGPIADFTATTLFSCQPPLSTSFNDNSTIDNGAAITSWTWNFGSGSPQTSNTASTPFTYNTPGIYTVSVTVTDQNGCTDSQTISNYITVANVQAGIQVPDTNACRNTPETFTATAGIAAAPITYSWDFGDGQTGSGSPVNHTYASNNSYPVTLTVTDNNGCSSTTSREMFVHTTSAQFHFDAQSECVLENGIKKARVHAIFHSDSLEFTSNANYDWDLTAFHDANSVYADFTYDYNVPPGSYDATLTLTNDLGCIDTYTIPGAIVIPGPTGSFSFSPDSGCSPLTVNFVGHSQNSAIYSWDFGDGTTITGTSDTLQTHTYTAVNVYNPQFYVGFQLSNDICYVPTPPAGDIKVTSLIGVDILEDSIYVTYGEKDTLNVVVNDPFGNPPYTYNWTPAAMVTSGPAPNSFLATTTGHDEYYYVSVPYGTQGCSGIDSVLVKYKICEALLKIPNVFTPDDDNNLNNVYEIKELCQFDDFRFRIYNRWGRIIFESTDPKFQWDGTTSGGSKASDGTYFYVLNARTQELHGYIDLIRSKK